VALTYFEKKFVNGKATHPCSLGKFGSSKFNENNELEHE
jgi:hypothetical protein